MKRKIFISLNISEKDRKRIARIVEKWQDLPIKWTKDENLALPLVSLGFVEENDLAEICEKIRRAAEKIPSFDLDFDQVGLFPSAILPRSVALLGENNESLKNLVNEIEKELNLSSAPKKTFCPHLVFGRIRKTKWAELEEKPDIHEKISLNISVETVSVMSNNFESGKTEGEYISIEDCPLSF